jgi:hypothetical protein
MDCGAKSLCDHAVALCGTSSSPRSADSLADGRRFWVGPAAEMLLLFKSENVCEEITNMWA